MKFKILIFINFILAASITMAEEKMRIAIIDLQAKEVPNIIAVGVSNMIRSDLVDTGLFTVVERQQMSEILKEQEFQMTGCTDNKCAVEVGKLLSARKMVMGDITKIGGAYIITIRVVDVEKGVAEFSSKEKAASDSDLDKTASALTAKLIGRITGKTKSELLAGLEARTMSGYYLRSIIPGWGQLYADRNLEGGTFLGLFAAGCGFSGWAYYNLSARKKSYNDLPRGSSEFDGKYSDYRSAVNLFNISLYVLAGIYVAHWADAIFIAKPDFAKKDEKSALKEGPYLRLVFDGGTVSMPETRFGVTVGYRF